MIYAESTSVTGSCGVGVFYNFLNTETYYTDGPINELINRGGCNWLLASFIEGDKNCEEAYEILCKRYKLVYQSPVRENRNSDNMFFFCIFDGGEKGEYGFDDAENN